jgi:CxxC-x17-CxxC domain-containing protein
MEDQVFQCRTCGREFTFTVREQEFFAEKGFDTPSHCSECRAQRKRERTGGAGQFGSITARSAQREDWREWTEAICASCGRTTQVPFKPTTGRPVFCRECFAKQSREGVARRKTPPKPGEHAEKPPASSEPVKSMAFPAVESLIHGESAAWLDDPGPLPEIEPAPDEEGEITEADFIPMPLTFGSTPEEVNPEFEENKSKSSAEIDHPDSRSQDKKDI